MVPRKLNLSEVCSLRHKLLYSVITGLLLLVYFWVDVNPSVSPPRLRGHGILAAPHFDPVKTKDLQRLVIVPGHAVTVRNDISQADRNENVWFLHSYQVGTCGVYIFAK